MLFLKKSHLQKFLVLTVFLFLGAVFIWIEISSPKSLSQNLHSDSQEQIVQIEHVFDGDTFSANINGATEKIRILGIDTPEVSEGYRDAECFGENASAFTKKILSKKSVVLIKSQTGDQTDQYGRFLRYVEREGKDFGAMLIEEGYAESYKKFPHDRKTEYNALEQEAKSAKKGLWGKCK